MRRGSGKIFRRARKILQNALHYATVVKCFVAFRIKDETSAEILQGFMVP